jgi:hypothetical protein
MRTLVLAALLAPAIAAANGRSPQTNGVFLRPADTQSIYIRATFGLLISRDNGCTFRWVCERALGYGGEFDPKYAIAADGTIFATTFDGLRVSRDGGCTWATATAELPRNDPGYIADIWIDALDIAPTGEVWIATAESAQPNDVYSSTDGGVTFQPRGLRSPTIWWKSVKVARTDPERVYLTGYQVAGTSPDGGMASPLARLMRSSDNGQTWTELDLLASDPPMRFGATPIVLIAAVDPKAADTLLLTSLNANGKGDRLYRSTDAGATSRSATSCSRPTARCTSRRSADRSSRPTTAPRSRRCPARLSCSASVSAWTASSSAVVRTGSPTSWRWAPRRPTPRTGPRSSASSSSRGRSTAPPEPPRTSSAIRCGPTCSSSSARPARRAARLPTPRSNRHLHRRRAVAAAMPVTGPRAARCSPA